MRLPRVLFFLPLICAAVAHADEKIGTFAVEELRLRPTYSSTEGQGGQFSLDDSAFGVGWHKDKYLSGYFEVGPLAQRFEPYYWSPPAGQAQSAVDAGYGLTKAYAQYDGIYGRVRFGMIPINFGYEGSMHPQERYFPWSQLMESRLIGYDDMGLSFYTEFNGYYTEFIIHNGEIETSADGRLWTTAHFGWDNHRDWRAQLSLQTGFVNADQSTNSTLSVAGVAPGQTAKWRNGAAFVNWHPRDWNVVLQTAAGQVAQNIHTGNYSADMAEATHFFSNNFGVGLRYDYFNPNSSTGVGETSAASVLVAMRSDDGTSTVLLTGTKNVHTSSTTLPDDRLVVAWLLAPYAR